MGRRKHTEKGSSFDDSSFKDHELPEYNYEKAYFTTTDFSEVGSGEMSGYSSKHKNGRLEKYQLLPVKIKDVIHMVENNSDFKGKSPVKINMREKDLDEIMRQQNLGSSLVLTATPKSPTESIRSRMKSFNASRESQNTKPFINDQNPQIYAMNNIQAFPAVGGSGFRIDNSRTVRRAPRAQRRVIRHRRKPRSKSRNRLFDRFRSRSRSRPKHMRVQSARRVRPRVRRRTPSRHFKVRPRRRTPVIVKRRYRTPITYCPPPAIEPCYRDCSPFPLCDVECTRNTRSHPGFPSVTCDCTLCEEKLQFIQPGVCTKKKAMWTNEYAIIPKPQVNLIDPCEKLDPVIYPRADRPCIRDGQGNPLTDCIGRPLRDPVGKKFMRFSANGSLMATNFRGNYHTGQPPLCVKCPLPDIYSCKPDRTHDQWLGCGYPIRPNMSPFFNHVVATENVARY